MAHDRGGAFSNCDDGFRNLFLPVHDSTADPAHFSPAPPLGWSGFAGAGPGSGDGLTAHELAGHEVCADSRHDGDVCGVGDTDVGLRGLCGGFQLRLVL